MPLKYNEIDVISETMTRSERAKTEVYLNALAYNFKYRITIFFCKDQKFSLKPIKLLFNANNNIFY